MHVCDILSIFVFSRNFSETAWRAFKAARQLMLFLWCLWVPEMGPPGGTTRPARWRLETYQFSGFLLKLLCGNDQPLGDANLSPRSGEKLAKLMSAYFCPHLMFNYGYLIEFVCLKIDLIGMSYNWVYWAWDTKTC